MHFSLRIFRDSQFDPKLFLLISNTCTKQSRAFYTQTLQSLHIRTHTVRLGYVIAKSVAGAANVLCGGIEITVRRIYIANFIKSNKGKTLLSSSFQRKFYTIMMRLLPARFLLYQKSICWLLGKKKMFWIVQQFTYVD